jgi:hypothetical protein
MRKLTEDATFRANPRYELVVLDRLVASDGASLRQFDDAPDLYGALVPRDGSVLETRSVSSDTALLFLTLATPGPLPRYVRAQLGSQTERTVLRLIADGVLELLDRGAFVSGPTASTLLTTVGQTDTRSPTSLLSVAALQYGQALVGLAESELAMRLYCYGRQPITPALRHRLPDAPAVAAHLGIDAGGRLQAKLDDKWVESRAPIGVRQHWWQWAARSSASRTAVSANRGYKLYLSPAIDGVGVALEALTGILASGRGATGFKVAADVPGLCRPDKIIVYFNHLDMLQGLAAKLGASLSGLTAHGVAFTASITTDGLLSWGADPPLEPEASGGPTSWRMWVTRRLAGHLVTAMTAGSTRMSPCEFALNRMRLGGVDTERWIPAGGVGLRQDQLEFA